jgi:calcineurin-like phosphoesterase family protein
MNKIFVTADTHFGHANIILFENPSRPYANIYEHDLDLVARWNATVQSGDTVWHLGDVFFGGRDNHQVLGHLQGTKKLVLGNHDHYPLDVYQQYFSKIYGVAEFRHSILTHIPVHENQLHRYKKNIHGHMHSKKLDDPRYVCVSVEHWDLRPVLMDTVLA